jgi:hypothetical protein
LTDVDEEIALEGLWEKLRLIRVSGINGGFCFHRAVYIMSRSFVFLDELTLILLFRIKIHPSE